MYLSTELIKDYLFKNCVSSSRLITVSCKMGSVFLTSVFLAPSLVTAECRFIKRLSERSPAVPENESAYNETCEVVIYMNCVLPNLDQCSDYFGTYESAIAAFSNRTRLEAFAGDFRVAADCVELESNAPRCEGGEYDEQAWNLLLLMADYLDSRVHLYILEAATESPCVSDTAKQEEAAWSLAFC